MKEQAIVSFANQKGNYVKALSRLNESLRHNFDGDFLGFIGEAAVGSPAHVDVPYAFKIHCFKKAFEAGYKFVLYLDSSCFAIKSVQPAFDEIRANGFLFQEAGHLAGVWTNDNTLKYFGITRDEAMNMVMIGNAGMLGLNMNMGRPQSFFSQWEEAMKNGAFNGAWNNDNLTESSDTRCKGSRHDMSCSSIIANQMGIIDLAKKGDQWLQYAGPYDATLNDTIIFKAQGM